MCDLGTFGRGLRWEVERSWLALSLLIPRLGWDLAGENVSEFVILLVLLGYISSVSVGARVRRGQK